MASPLPPIEELLEAGKVIALNFPVSLNPGTTDLSFGAQAPQSGLLDVRATLDLGPHALAPIAELPVREVISATHIVADLTLGLGKVVYDYLKV